MRRKLCVIVLLVALSLQLCFFADAQAASIDGDVVVPARLVIKLLGHDIPLGILISVLDLNIVLGTGIYAISSSGTSQLTVSPGITIKTSRSAPDNSTPGEYNGRPGFWNNFGEFTPAQ